MTDTDDILYDVADKVATITLNRPDKMNAWSPDMEVAFRAAIDRAADDDRARAIVVTGAGKGFCAGADLAPGPDGKPRPRIVPPFSADDFGQLGDGGRMETADPLGVGRDHNGTLSQRVLSGDSGGAGAGVAAH